VLVRFGRPPALSGLRVRGRKLSYRDTQAATTTITVSALTKHGRKLLGSLTHADLVRGNALSLPARLDGHKLGAGRYVLTAVPVADGLRGASASVRFTLAG
jgi:hypothetical protein